MINIENALTDHAQSIESRQKVFGLNGANKCQLLGVCRSIHGLAVLIHNFSQRHHHCNLDQVFDFGTVPILGSVAVI